MIYFKASTPYPLIAVPFCLLTNQSMSVTERYYCVFDVLLDCHSPPPKTHTHTHTPNSATWEAAVHLDVLCPGVCTQGLLRPKPVLLGTSLTRETAMWLWSLCSAKDIYSCSILARSLGHQPLLKMFQIGWAFCMNGRRCEITTIGN